MLKIDNKQIIYQYFRGSYAYGTYIEGVSDKDTAGIFVLPEEVMLGLPENYIEQLSDEKNDNILYEVGRYLSLLIKSNPNMLEGLFVPEKCVIYKHPIMDEIIKNRDIFLTKESLKSLSHYAFSQIKKARGLNKKIVNPITERKTPIDFCYTFNDKQGTEPILSWLEARGLKQIYCGLNHLPNMNQMYGVFYDWGQHLHMEYKTKEEFIEAYYKVTDEELEHNLFWKKIEHLTKYYRVAMEGHIEELYDIIKPSGYHGIVKEDGSSCDIHLDSILKGDTRICNLQFNEDGYQTHCRQYKEYKEWEEKRNPIRYESNLNKNYDSKNMSHCVRLLTMATELAKGDGFIVDRTGIDADFLLNIRNHKFEYDEIIKYSERKYNELIEAMETCNLPETVDKEKVNKLLIDVRKKCYKEYKFIDSNINGYDRIAEEIIEKFKS